MIFQGLFFLRQPFRRIKLCKAGTCLNPLAFVKGKVGDFPTELKAELHFPMDFNGADEVVLFLFLLAADLRHANRCRYGLIDWFCPFGVAGKQEEDSEQRYVPDDLIHSHQRFFKPSIKRVKLV